jgi:DNA-binding beta-propeller fold protein YncE
MSVIVGSGKFKYEVAERWDKLPEGWEYVEVPGVAVDPQDRVYVFTRGEHPVIIYDRDGNLLRSWGEGMFSKSHMVRFSEDGSVWYVDRGNHTVKKFSSDDKLLLTLGNEGQPSETGWHSNDYGTITHAGPPFNNPTDVAFAVNGDIYVTDGYGNARVHKFAADGTSLFSWGEPGTGPGQFNIPHSVCLDKSGRVYVADRENNRIQVFTPDGEFITQWTSVTRPNGLFIDDEENIFVGEIGYRYGLHFWYPPPTPESPQPNVSIWNLKGELQARWGGEDTLAPGNFCCPHQVCLDSHGDLYVSEMVWTAAASKGILPKDYHSLQKFIRIS